MTTKRKTLKKSACGRRGGKIDWTKVKARAKAVGKALYTVGEGAYTAGQYVDQWSKRKGGQKYDPISGEMVMMKPQPGYVSPYLAERAKRKIAEAAERERAARAAARAATPRKRVGARKAARSARRGGKCGY